MVDGLRSLGTYHNNPYLEPHVTWALSRWWRHQKASLCLDVFLISIDPVYLSNQFIRYSKCDIYRHRGKHGGSPQGYDTRRRGGLYRSLPICCEYSYVIQSSGKLSLSLCVFWCETAVHSVNVTVTITTNTRWYIDVNGNIKLETRMGQRRRIKRISRRRRRSRRSLCLTLTHQVLMPSGPLCSPHAIYI